MPSKVIQGGTKLQHWLLPGNTLTFTVPAGGWVAYDQYRAEPMIDSAGDLKALSGRLAAGSRTIGPYLQKRFIVLEPTVNLTVTETDAIDETSDSPFDITDLTNLGGYWDARDLADGAVSSWVSRDPFAQTLVQATGTAQPTKGSGVVTLDGSTDKMLSAPPAPVFVQYHLLPDVLGSQAGKGFSNNGLCRAADGTWWLGNGGKPTENSSDAVRHQSLVHLSADFSTVLHEIDLEPIIDAENINPPRGLALDTLNNHLLVPHTTTGGTNVILRIGDIESGGSLIGTFEVAASSIAYSPADHCFFVLQTSNSQIRKHSAVDGSVLETWSSSETYQDHIQFDPVSGLLFLFCGDNDGPANMVVLSPINKRTMTSVALEEIDGAVEQGVIYGGKLFVNSNAYFHSPSGSLPALNRVLEYNIPPLWADTTIHAFGVWMVPSVTTLDELFGSEQADKWRGWGFATNSVTNIRLFHNTGADDTTTNRAGGNYTVPNMSATQRIFYAEFKVGTGCSLWVDGTFISTIADTVPTTGHIKADKIKLSMPRDAGKESRQDTLGIGYTVGSADRQQIEGWLAHEHGLTARLPADHPYKTDPP